MYLLNISMNFNFKCKHCNWKSFVDPNLFKAEMAVTYNCTKCSSMYVIVEDDIGTEF